MLKLQDPPAQGLPDPGGQDTVVPRPVRIGSGYLDADGSRAAGHPGRGSRGRRGVIERHDLGSAGHQRSLLPGYRLLGAVITNPGGFAVPVTADRWPARPGQSNRGNARLPTGS